MLFRSAPLGPPPVVLRPVETEPAADPQEGGVVVRGRDYRLSGIMKGADGDVAIINGKFAGVGETVDGARVVNIRRHSVELDLDGQKIVVQM